MKVCEIYNEFEKMGLFLGTRHISISYFLIRLLIEKKH